MWYGALATAAATFVGNFPVSGLICSMVTASAHFFFLLVVRDLQPPRGESPKGTHRAAGAMQTRVHRLRRFCRLGYGLKFAPRNQDLSPGERNAHRVCRRRARGYRRRWPQGPLRTWTEDSHPSQWFTGTHVLRPMEILPRLVSIIEKRYDLIDSMEKNGMEC